MKAVFSFLALSILTAPAAFAVANKAPAPEFTAKSSTGKVVRLSDYLGKTVVLEWTNPGCPFVQKHYQSKNMQNLQKEYKGKGVIWLTVASSAAGKQGHLDAKSGEAFLKEQGADPTALLLDEKGEIGQLYKAETTPHMYVVNPKGRLVYQGAIDDKPSADQEDIKGARNYVREALDATLADKEVKEYQTKSYGCSVKYK
jgi:peroxiredoxin